MTKPNVSEARKLNDNELKEKIDSMRKELFALRFQRATRQLTETHRFKEARLKLAQFLTVQSERNRSTTSS